MGPLYYLGAFVLALGILIVVHELGHFLVARWCGIKVLRFSVGFGKPLLVRRFGRDSTEWAVCVFPLGGYVKMLDEREAPVEARELHRAFNRQPVAKRFAVVAAGPVANFLLAVILYWGLFVHGTEEIRPILGAPTAQSVASASGFSEGDVVLSVADRAVDTWNDFRWEILRKALERQPVAVGVRDASGEAVMRQLDLGASDAADLDGDVVQQLGLRLFRPAIPPIIGSLASGGPAEAAGLLAGDKVTEIDSRTVGSWGDVLEIVRAAPGRPLRVVVERGGRTQSFDVTTGEAVERGQRIGRLGIALRDDPSRRSQLMHTVRYGPIDALTRAAKQTYETALFSLRVLGRMVTGDVSWRNLSGPVTIADFAGQSARLGLAYYIKFLALISISLGVLNLLPIPLLDGGHLMYYIFEIIKGGPVSEKAMEIGQQIGLAVLVMLMAFAFYNDINRLVSS
ncbi:MAG: RIP metalloprotease RseP [Betaproteobacteria bacterium]|nr:RIP metalloprotease RseP [Betaproteobacteria bacterium]